MPVTTNSVFSPDTFPDQSLFNIIYLLYVLVIATPEKLHHHQSWDYFPGKSFIKLQIGFDDPVTIAGRMGEESRVKVMVAKMVQQTFFLSHFFAVIQKLQY